MDIKREIYTSIILIYYSCRFYNTRRSRGGCELTVVFEMPNNNNNNNDNTLIASLL